MLLSVVSVVKKPSKDFERTYTSVLREFSDSDDVEYLIKAWDAEVELQNASVSSRLENQLTVRRIVSRDQGVFDGMNQSIDVANGKWILFLNDGDWLAEGIGTLLMDALRYKSDYQYVYSDGVTVDATDGREFFRKAPEVLCLPDFLHYAPVLHPCLVVQKVYLKAHPFNLNYDLAADYDLMVKLVSSGSCGYRLNALGAFILSGGLSELSRIRGKRQALASLLENVRSTDFRMRSRIAFVRFLLRHILILCVIRKITFLQKYARSRTGGRPSGFFARANLTDY